MNGRKIGIWLIGAWGQIGTASAVVLAGLQRRTIATDGFVTQQPEFTGLDLVDWSRFVLGGHEIRKTSFDRRSAESVRQVEDRHGRTLWPSCRP